VAAGSAITQDVPAGALALGRARQVIKPGWATERGKRRAAKLPEGPVDPAPPLAAKAPPKG
jgi:bifunctional UDP-N-acetylglucosamine pyrophosphorylase / glucosamine-1-phosphate N-acetyltransferase